MDIKTIASIAGVLGFFISVATFVLTRFERRKRLLVEIFKGDISQYSDEFTLNENDEFEELLKIRVTNIGGQPVVLNPESYYFKALGNKLDRYKTDWCGVEKVPSPLAAGQSCEVAVFVDALVNVLGIKELDKYCNQKDFEKTRVPLEAGVFSHNGKKFSCDNFHYFHYVGELERIT